MIFRKKKIRALGPKREVIFLPVRHHTVSGRVWNDVPPVRRRQQDEHVSFHSVLQSGSGSILHTYGENTGLQESEMVKIKSCFPGTQDEH